MGLLGLAPPPPARAPALFSFVFFKEKLGSSLLVNDPGVRNLASGSPMSLYLDFLSLLFSVIYFLP